MVGETFGNILTPRELQVLELVVAGATNKRVARALKISPRTVEVHRMRIMSKLRAGNVADLVRIVINKEIPISSDHIISEELKAALDAASAHLVAIKLELQRVESRIAVCYQGLGNVESATSA